MEAASSGDRKWIELVKHIVRANRPHRPSGSALSPLQPVAVLGLPLPPPAGFAPTSAVLGSLLPVSDGDEGREKRKREGGKGIGERDRIERDR